MTIHTSSSKWAAKRAEIGLDVRVKHVSRADCAVWVGAPLYVERSNGIGGLGTAVGHDDERARYARRGRDGGRGVVGGKSHNQCVGSVGVFVNLEVGLVG